MMQHPVSMDSPRPSSVSSSQSNQSNSSSRHQNDICVGEELRIAVGIALERFRLSEESKVLEFPSSFTSQERAYIHRLCDTLGLKHKSKGRSSNRYLCITKKDTTTTTHATSTFNLVRNSRHQIASLLQRFSLTAKERQDLQPRTERSQYSEAAAARELNKTTTGRLNNGVPQVPPVAGQSDLLAFRQTLPVYGMWDDIIEAINNNKVLMIAGETGSGKTTQVPQMILDDCQASGKPCRIFCTQPRRLSALSIAERVAAERGEKVGQTVGYQIRLESRVSPKTLLTFCTNGVLLRTLMGGDQPLSSVTHVVVDEIHERDRFSDFLLIALRDALPRFRNLKIILMSAALNTQLFSTYFSGCPIINVPGKLFDVQEFFLEDILKQTGFTNASMKKYKQQLKSVESQQKQLHDWCSLDLPDQDLANLDDLAEDPPLTGTDPATLPTQLPPASAASHTSRDATVDVGATPEREDLEPWLIKEMDNLLSEAWHSGRDETFSQILHLLLAENVSVDFSHSETSATPLMVAAGRGLYHVVEKLLSLGANVNLRASNDWTALDWAQKFDHTDIIELLESHIASSGEQRHDEEVLVKQCLSMTLTDEDRDLLNVYHHSFDDEKVDLDLIMALLHKIHSCSQEGAVLIFLPGYDEIVSLRDRIQEDKRFVDSNRYMLYTLHSQMQSTDQKRVFKTSPAGVRKIILSTNIAETSITIDDVVFVIDSGKVKEKSFDALTSVSTLKAHWISKASALQRKGRAGRCRAGVCYHLFSLIRHTNMQEYQDPEILRCPLQELCLHTKLLAPANCPIADFLARAPEPPAFLITRNAVHLLKQIDALDTFEDMTELGHHLADLPVDPRYGKMILYSVVLKCLDPILTIACTLAYRDPFRLPAQPYQKRAVAMVRRKFAADTNSDHMSLLRAFQAWQKARTEGWERSFCDKNFLAPSTFEMIVGMRTQLLGQLRASGFVRARGGGDIRDLNTNSENWAVVKAALCAGLYPNIIKVNKHKMQLTTIKENKVKFHTSSVLASAPTNLSPLSHRDTLLALPTDWMVYEEMTRAHILAQVRCCTVLSPITVAIFAGPAKLPAEAIREAESMGQGGGDCEIEGSDSEGEEKDEGPRTQLRLDDWLAFKVDSEAGLFASQLRQKWQSLFLRRMRTPAKPWSQVDEQVIRTVVGVLTNEEQALGLQQPSGIGQRPRPMATDSFVSSGGSRRGSYDTEQSDDSSTGGAQDNKQYTPSKGRPYKSQNTPPRKREPGFARAAEDHSETSSTRSGSTGAGSTSNSLRGSAASSPCTSPDPQMSGPGSPQSSRLQSLGQATGGYSGSHCRYFVMKSTSYKNLDISMQRGIWATSIANERKIDRAFRDGQQVCLIYSVQGSGHFQGYAYMVSPATGDKSRELSGHNLGSTFNVEWGKRANLPFQQCHHLLNPWNENKKIQISRDGQEVEPSVGDSLLQLWESLSPYLPKTTPQYGRSPESPNLGQPRGKDGQWGNHPGSYGRPQGQGPWSHGNQYHGQVYGGRGGGGYSGHGMPLNSVDMQQSYGQVYMPMQHVPKGGPQFSPTSSSQPMSPVMILQRGMAPDMAGPGGDNAAGRYPQHKSQNQ